MRILRAASQGSILLLPVTKMYILHYGKVLAYIPAYVPMVFAYQLKCLWLLLHTLFIFTKHWTFLGLLKNKGWVSSKNYVILKSFIWELFLIRYRSKSTKSRGALGLIHAGIWGRIREPYGGESMRILWIFTDSYVFDWHHYF